MSYTFPYDRMKLMALAAGSTMLLGLAAAIFALALVDAGQVRQAAAAAMAVVPVAATGLDAVTLAIVAGVVVTTMLLAPAARTCCGGRPTLVIDESGILDRRSGRRIPWAVVRAVTLRGRGLRTAIAVTVDAPAVFEHRGWWHRLMDRPRRGRSGPEFLVNVGALSCRAEDVALAIRACGGFPVARDGAPGGSC